MKSKRIENILRVQRYLLVVALSQGMVVCENGDIRW